MVPACGGTGIGSNQAHGPAPAHGAATATGLPASTGLCACFAGGAGAGDTGAGATGATAGNRCGSDTNTLAGKNPGGGAGDTVPPWRLDQLGDNCNEYGEG